MAFWRKLFRILPKQQIYIEGNITKDEASRAEILEGELKPIKTYFDADCPYEIVEREIAPARYKCPECGAVVLSGMDFCNHCGARQQQET